jgi:hypothetical protein
VRDFATIDSSCGSSLPCAFEHGGEPSSRQVDELLDERLAHRGRPGEDAAVPA